MTATATKDEFNPLSFEKKLTQLKDTQDSIQSLSAWCLQQRQHHKKIVASWLNVLKRAKVDQRLVLFYLANDVIQYSKRKNYEFVESWGTTLQKATPLVRDEKVKHRILRIFKIWEERNVYDEEFLTDLTGLLSAAAGKQPDSDPSEFQAMQLVNKIKQCSVLEADTDLQLKNIHDSSLALKDVDLLCASLKERRDAEEAAVEVEEGVVRLEGYVRALQKELVARAALCHLLHSALQHYGVQRGEVKVVANAYRNFGSRVRNLKRRLDELCDTLPSSAQQTNASKSNNVAANRTSPVPSPPQPGESVPSPGPDEDIDLPQDGGEDAYNLDKTFSASILGDEMGKGFASFMGHTEFPFFSKDLNDSSAGSKIEVISSHPQSASDEDFNINDFLKSLIQTKPNHNSGADGGYPSNDILTPPPLPPTLPGLDLLSPSTPSTTTPISAVPTPGILVPPPPPPLVNNFYGSNNPDPKGVPAPEPYIPDHGSQWSSNSWENSMETPESPPHADTVSNMSVPLPVYTEPPPPPPRADVDHRSLQHISQPPPVAHHNSILEADDVDHRVLPPPLPHNQAQNADRSRSHKADVDHRNLISLTGTLPPPPAPPLMGPWSPRRQSSDQDYRNISGNEMTTMIPPPPLPPLQLRRTSIVQDSPPPSKIAKTIPSTPPIVVSSLPPNMPSHTPDMSKLPPNLPNMNKFPPNMGPMMPPHPQMGPDMSQLPPAIHGHPPSFSNDLSQVPLPPLHPQMHAPPNMSVHPPNIHQQNMNMMGMPGQKQFSSHSNDQNSMSSNNSISHLPPSSMLKHPPDVLNQNHGLTTHHGMNQPPPNMSHHHNPMMNQGGMGMMGRHNRTDIVESIDMEMSDEELMDDEYTHLGIESKLARMHGSSGNMRNKSFSTNNRVLVGGDTNYSTSSLGGDTHYSTSSSYNNKPVHIASSVKTDTRSNLVRINSISEEDMKKDDKPVQPVPVDFVLTENLISDDEDFFNEISDLNDDDDDKTNKSPDIFDEVLLSSSNPENPNTKSDAKESEKAEYSAEKTQESEEGNESDGLKEEPQMWSERVSAMNPTRPSFQGRPPFHNPHGHNRFRHPSVFHRLRAPHGNEYFNHDYRPRAPMRRPWGPRQPRGFW